MKDYIIILIQQALDCSKLTMESWRGLKRDFSKLHKLNHIPANSEIWKVYRMMLDQ